jgi:hypothetical protein
VSLQLFNYSLDQFSEQLNAAELASDVTLTSIAPVSGYTLEAQLRALDGLPVISVEPVSPPLPSESVAPNPARYAVTLSYVVCIGSAGSIQSAYNTRRDVHEYHLSFSECFVIPACAA